MQVYVFFVALVAVRVVGAGWLDDFEKHGIVSRLDGGVLKVDDHCDWDSD